MTSERQKKRDVAQGLRELRARPGWDPGKFRAPSASSRLRERVEGERVGEVLQAADECDKCAELRKLGDPTALCPAHLRAAMGL